MHTGDTSLMMFLSYLNVLSQQPLKELGRSVFIKSTPLNTTYDLFNLVFFYFTLIYSIKSYPYKKKYDPQKNKHYPQSEKIKSAK